MRKFLRYWTFRYWYHTRIQDVWKAVGLLTAMNQTNGSAQVHLDVAKDALYRAIREFEAQKDNLTYETTEIP
jgi:hypothetical protein